MDGLLLVLATAFVIFSLLGLVLAGWAAHMANQANIRLVGLENSTHHVQYVPMPDPAQPQQARDEFGMPAHDDGEADKIFRKGERVAFDGAGGLDDLEDETFTN